MVTHIGPLLRTDRQNFQFLKIKDGGGRHLEKSQTLRYIRNDLTNLYEIWYTDAKWVS